MGVKSLLLPCCQHTHYSFVGKCPAAVAEGAYDFSLDRLLPQSPLTSRGRGKKPSELSDEELFMQKIKEFKKDPRKPWL
jgi:hypothetical protein